MMGFLDSIKDPATGQIKKPILYTMIGGGGLVAFLLLKGSGGATGGTSSTGQTTPLTPDLTGLQDALKKLGEGGGGGGSSSTGGSTGGTGAAGATGATGAAGTSSSTSSSYTQSGYVQGSSGAAGGGGGGTGQVLNPVAKSPTIYAGLAIPRDQEAAYNAASYDKTAAKTGPVLGSPMVESKELAMINRAAGGTSTKISVPTSATKPVAASTVNQTYASSKVDSKQELRVVNRAVGIVKPVIQKEVPKPLVKAGTASKAY